MPKYVDIDDKNMLTPFTLCLNSEYRQGWNACLDHMKIRVVDDVVKVIRCKDCKHCQKFISKQGLTYECTYNKDYSPIVSLKDYCSRGERK